jgi:hypothetical protein
MVEEKRDMVINGAIKKNLQVSDTKIMKHVLHIITEK